MHQLPWSKLRLQDAANPLPSTRAYHSKACLALSNQDATARDGLAFSLERGVYQPPVSGTTRRVQRRQAWEDTNLQPVLDKDDLTSMGMNRSSHACRRRMACDAIATPLALGTVQRPARGFRVGLSSQLDGNESMLFVLGIEKCGSSSLAGLFNVPPLAERTQHWQAASVLLDPRCRQSTGMTIIEDVARLASDPAGDYFADARLHAPARRGVMPASGCGLATSFGVPARDERAYRMAVVRSPLDRFISAHNEHGKLAACVPFRPHSTRMALPWMSVESLAHGKCPTVLEEYVGKAEYLANARPLTLHLVPPHSTIHFRTQTYFLSSTDSHGRPMRWDRLARLESLEADAGQVVAAVLEASASRQAASPRERARGALQPPFFRSERNVRGRSREGAALKATLANHSAFMCNLCRVYYMDYLCLGYEWPAPCARSPCYESLPSRVRHALSLLHERMGGAVEADAPRGAEE